MTFLNLFFILKVRKKLLYNLNSEEEIAPSAELQLTIEDKAAGAKSDSK